MAAGLDELSRRGNAFTVVIGHPEFYQRTGFVPASPLGIGHGFDEIPQEFLLARCEESTMLETIRGGSVLYRPEVGQQF